ncbi:hypothetical protein H4683_000580 [Filibacter limicola]|uniref:Stage V sporulation protein M n=1 Tax=Sporosarcina limicola TaxID=34101 RepID=A0A927MGT1_9BACL|nr:hypothetical protein [Sporosarcina limicola]
MRVYTFTLPKIVSGIVRKYMVVFHKEEQTKATASKRGKAKKKTKEKTSS